MKLILLKFWRRQYNKKRGGWGNHNSNYIFFTIKIKIYNILSKILASIRLERTFPSSITLYKNIII